MQRAFALIAAACLTGTALTLSPGQPPAGGGPQPPPSVPVLVELFTAEGCSSCPPADMLLEKMIESQPAAGASIIGLGEHVDYWDRLGWKDRFSSAAMTARQQKYADRSRNTDIYTPQMVVDGQEVFVGSDLNAARRAIESAIGRQHGTVRLAVEILDGNVVRATGTISLPAGAQSAKVGGLPASAAGDLSRQSAGGATADRADLLVAITEDRLRTDVKRGENQGRTLTHAAVVRDLRTVAEGVGASSSIDAKIKLSSDWSRPNLKIVAFVQERTSRRVLATTAMAIPTR